MGLHKNRQIDRGVLDPSNQDSTRFRRFARDYFGVQPICTAAVGYGNPAGTTGAVSNMLTPKAAYEYVVLGGGQTIIAPVWGATGLDIAGDATADEGFEFTNGVTALNPAAHVVGTDKASYFKVTLNMSDVSVCDTLYVGWRKVQAYQTAATSYTDYACLGINASAAAAKIKILTNLNNGGEEETDTTLTWADAATKTFEIRVDDNGYANFLVNGALPTVTRTNFVFDSADTVIPFLFHLRASTNANIILLTLWEYGLVPRHAE